LFFPITTRAVAIYTHIKNDTLDKVDPSILLQACILFKKVILMIDKDYNKLCKNEELVCDIK